MVVMTIGGTVDELPTARHSNVELRERSSEVRKIAFEVVERVVDNNEHTVDRMFKDTFDILRIDISMM